MDISNDELNRQLRDLDREHREVMPKWRSAIMRLMVDDKETPVASKSALLTGGVNRRGFLKLGGATVVAGAVLAACGNNNDTPSGATSDTTDGGGGGGGGNETDITVARTAASLEIFAVSVYDTAISNAGALGISKPVGTAAQVFRDQHDEHGKAFNAAAEQLGGKAFTMANPQAEKAFADAIAGLKNEEDVIRFAYDLETIAAQTYQGVGVSLLSTPQLRQTSMSVGGVEARHAAILGSLVSGLKSVPGAFQGTDKAVTKEFFV